MSLNDGNEIVEDDFSLSELLMPDTPDVKEIKSLYNREEEYSDYLSEIEFAIAGYYEENRNLKDKDVKSALKNIKQNRDKPISFFEKELEREIAASLVEPLEEFPLTNYEFTLVLDYVLWVIDNRSWIEDKQAYVKWITYVLGFFSEEEEKKYERQFKKFARKMGVSAAQADLLLMKREATEDLFEEGGIFEELALEDIFEKDRVADDLETGFFLMTDEEKFDFLLDKGLDYFELVQDYVSELAKNNDFDRIQEFYKKFNEKHKNFFPIHFIIGTVYFDKDPSFAKSCFQETLIIASKLKEIPEETKDDLRASIALLGKLLEEEKKEEKPEKKTGAGRKGRKGRK